MWKNGKKRKIAIFWYLTKREISQVQNDLQSWNLSKSYKIIFAKPLHDVFRWFQYFWNFAVLVQNLTKIPGQILNENCNQKYSNHQKRRVQILHNIIVHNLAKFQLSRSFWTWVISIFVRYQEIKIFCFWPFLHLNWPEFCKL